MFGGLNNITGWKSIGLAWLLGLLQSAFAFVGFDITIHISEEMPNPGKEGPKLMLLTIIIGGVSGLLVLLCMLFCISDIDAVLGSIYG